MRPTFAVTPHPKPDSDSNGHGNDYHRDHQGPFKRMFRNMTAGSAFFGRLLDVVDLRRCIIVEHFWRCIYYDLYLLSVGLLIMYEPLTYLRRQSACVELKSCRIPVTFWSSNSLIVFDEFQRRRTEVSHAVGFDKSLLGKKCDVDKKGTG